MKDGCVQTVEQQRLAAELAAKKIVEKRYPYCELALLAGSVVRHESTETSDLDLVIIMDKERLQEAYRESFFLLDWPVEAFVHTEVSLAKFFTLDVERGRPSLPQMVQEGLLIKGSQQLSSRLKKEAKQLLIKGPKRWPTEEINRRRYFITDLLDDLKGSTIRAEQIFIVNELIQQITEFILGTNQKWQGNSKWTIRLLEKHDKNKATQLLQAMESFYQEKEKHPIIQFTINTLKPYGGPYFEGFSIGK
ncbi:hypothetical protein AB990_01530 [Alkalihalobacillus pseudalcaliphilus]|nr:hypothetical protein AB990_01530 [Alkalihalobacillus pseudalcaliphilus]